MSHEIHTEKDLLNAAAQALDARDEDALYEMIEVVEGWMIGEGEASAYKAVLCSMIEAIGQMTE